MARIDGRAGNDGSLRGGAADDVVSGLSGADRLAGAGGDDRLTGGEGSDRARGGAGNDTLIGDDPGGGSTLINSARIETGLDRLVFAAVAPGDDAFFLVEQQNGAVHRFDLETGSSTPFLDLPEGAISTAGEEGLLGLAFHPDYAANGRFFLHLVNDAGNVEVREFRRDADDPSRADPGSGRTVIEIQHPGRTNHNGGTVAFGPDGMLYVSVGDGGGRGDPDGNGQNPDTLLGAILRLDIDGDDFPADAARNYAIPADNPFAVGGGAPEIWDFGLRNPFRFGFDPETGDLLIGDVGQGQREEISLHPAGAPGGINFGWNIREGFVPFAGGPTEGLTDPIFDYSRDLGVSVTGGGFVPEGGGLAGAYVFADFVTGRFFTLRAVDGAAVDAVERTEQFGGDGLPENVAAFATGPDGALYAVSLRGALFRLEFGAAAGAGDDTLRGGTGDDRILGGAGDDRLFGQAGEDTLRGGGGEDMLKGGAGADIIRGGAGRDRIEGRGGDDALIGGGGADVFVFGRRNGDDDVRGFRAGSDIADLSALRLEGFEALAQALSDGPEGARLDLSALGGSGSVTFHAVAAAALQANDFIF
ncbi:MAG: PQQ-dependent sugar dehydrogenase [Pikeienuella sp.]|uniref:PQQ-dependent sugar dehydrogenase n=1 Tax=Pikeienuella sp. TaxID=2831957 RepID=UPI00391D8931